MRTSSRRRLAVFVILASSLLIGGFVALAAAVGDTERITGYQVAAVLGDEGLVVTEVIDYDFGPSPRRGIYRDIPDAVPDSISVFSPTAPDDMLVTEGYWATEVRIGDPDVTIVLGVNDADYDPGQHRIVSNASCTTNCLAPFAKVLHEEWGIEAGWMTTIHAYTNDQVTQDGPHSDLRRARAAGLSMIPTSTGAAKAIGLVLPELKGKLDGYAMRVPTADVSIVDLSVKLKKSTDVEGINGAMKAAAQGPLQGILQYCDEPLVSVDFLGNTHSSILDAPSTKVMDGNFAKVLSWYDNETGYATRVVDLAERMAQ